MGFWDSVAALPLQNTATVKQPITTNNRTILRDRLDDEKQLVDHIARAAEELIATKLTMMVTRELPLLGATEQGIEQSWQSDTENLQVIKRTFTEQNRSYIRIETVCNVNYRDLFIAAEYHSDGSSLINHYPDGFSRSVAFAVTDEETKRIITRRILSGLTQASSRIALL